MSKQRAITTLGDALVERCEVPSPDDLSCGRVRVISKIRFDTGQIQLRSDATTNTGMILAYPGDLVISGINAAKGAIAIYELANTNPIAATIHYSAYTPNPDRADRSYLWWFLRSRSFRELLAEYVPGGIKTELKAKRLLPIPIQLPPLAEQRRAVARIEDFATQIHEAHILRDQAIKEAAALFESFLTTRLDSSGWPLKQLPEVAEVARGKFAHRPRNEPRFYGGDFPFIQIGDISKSGRYIRTHSQSLNKEGLAISRMFPAGTVAIAITGATIGVTGILGFDCVSRIALLGFRQNQISSVPSSFISLWSMRRRPRSQRRRRRRSQTSTSAIFDG